MTQNGSQRKTYTGCPADSIAWDYGVYGGKLSKRQEQRDTIKKNNNIHTFQVCNGDNGIIHARVDVGQMDWTIIRCTNCPWRSVQA